MSRLADILKQEYQTKGVFSGTASALSKRAREKMDIRNALFGGSGLGSIVGRKVFGKGYSATDNDKGKVSNVSEALSAGLSTILQEISISSKITAKNTLALPSMARDMFLVKENIIKLVRKSGETPREKAGDWFSRQSAREAAFEGKFNKSTSPTKVETKKDGGGFLSGLLSILGAVGSVFKAVLSPLTSLAAVLGPAALAVAAFGGSIWKILGFLAKTRIGKILGLSALALGATNVFGGGNQTNIDSTQTPTQGTDEGMSFGTKAAIGVAGYGIAKAGIAGAGLYKQTGEAIGNAKVAGNPWVHAAEKATPKAATSAGGKTWQGFLWFLEKALGKEIFAKISARLAVMGGLMAVPVVGWVGALINLGFNLYMAYEIYSLWKEYMGSPEEKPTSPTQVRGESDIIPSQNNNIVQPLNYGNSPTPVQQTESGAPSGSGGQGSYNLPKGKSISSNEAIDYLVKKGMTPAQAAGVVGNLLQESTLNSGAYNKAENAYGLGQWRGQRLTDLQNFAAARGKSIDDVNTQLDFIMHELNGKESKAGQMLFASKTADEAAYNFGKYYERPATVEQSRLSYATQSLAQYKPTGSSSSVELAQNDAMDSGASAIMAASSSAAGGGSKGGNNNTTNNIAVQAPAQQNQSQQVAMNSPAAFDTDLAKLLMSPMAL